MIIKLSEQEWRKYMFAKSIAFDKVFMYNRTTIYVYVNVGRG